MALGAILTIAHHIEECPELPNWVARSALAAISEYAVGKLLGAGQRRLLLRELLRFLRTDFGQGLKFASVISIRKVRCLMSTTTPVQKVDPRDKPLFYDLSPEFFDVSSSTNGQSREKMLRRLEIVDAVLAKSVAQRRE